MSRSLPPQLPDVTPSYQSLFQTVSEFPHFIVTYRWWEDEATTVLWAFNVPEISQVIRYGLFRDDKFPRSSLRSRNADTVDAFLVAMSDPREHQLLGSLSHFQRVEEILRRSSIPPFQPIPWNWFPLPPGHGLDARAIAAAIDTESHFQFTCIAFEEIVRASLGYNATSVEWFLLQHTALYIHLSDHLQTFPEEIPLYIEVEKVRCDFSFLVSLLCNGRSTKAFSAFADSQSICAPGSGSGSLQYPARIHSPHAPVHHAGVSIYRRPDSESIQGPTTQPNDHLEGV